MTTVMQNSVQLSGSFTALAVTIPGMVLSLFTHGGMARLSWPEE